MGKRRKTWLALNGLEFTPPGADSPVCWPWTQIKVVPKQGFMPLDANGERAKDARGKVMTVGCMAMLRDLGRLLKARALRGPMQQGEIKRFKCRSREELGLAVGAGVFAVVCGCCAFFGKHDALEFWFLCVVCVVLGVVLLRAAMQQNVAELTISTDGVDALLKDGTQVFVPWREMESGGIKRGSFRTLNGLTLRYKSNYDIQAAIRAARRKTAGFAAARRSVGKVVRRVVLTAAIASVLFGAAGALAVHLMALPPGARPTPLGVFTGTVGMGVLMACMFPLQIWLGICVDGRLMPAGVKVYSTAAATRRNGSSNFQPRARGTDIVRHVSFHYLPQHPSHRHLDWRGRLPWAQCGHTGGGEGCAGVRA